MDIYVLVRDPIIKKMTEYNLDEFIACNILFKKIRYIDRHTQTTKGTVTKKKMTYIELRTVH